MPEFPIYPNQDTDVPSKAYIYDQKNHTERRLDGQPLNDADVAYLIKRDYEEAIEVEKHSPNPKFHRTEREEELSFQFFYKHGEKSQKLCDMFLDLNRQAYQTNSPEERLALLHQCVDAFNKAKDWHYKYSKGGMIWFQDNWEYCHNSRNVCFNWINSVIDNIKEVELEINVISPWILDQAKSGFAQTDIYKRFPDEDKPFLRNIITRLADSGKIKKEKRGNTYVISAIEQDGSTD